ncbi:MAG TPA: hypothetical protein DCM38_14540, partial [Gammaproteobacteria bacterium]|nr:hypothetical protein [Gammaproteobacteria bacterium]
MIQQITADAVFDEAFQWLCERRINYPHNDDVWHLRFHWPRLRGAFTTRPVRGAVSLFAGETGAWAQRGVLDLGRARCP